jgi:choline kinase
LLPLTKDTPQCLLKINNKTILEKQIEYLNHAGINDITIITGYLSEQVEAFCKKLGINTFFNPFYDVSGMALTLWVAKKELTDDFILTYSDVLFDPILIKDLSKNDGEICLAIKKDNLREEAEKVIEESNIIKNVSKVKIPGENGEFIGISKFSKQGSNKLIKELNKVSKNNINSSFIDVIDNIIKEGGIIKAHDIGNSSFLDIDFPEDLEKAKKIF